MGNVRLAGTLRVELQALAAALEQWPTYREVCGVATDDTHTAIVHGRTVGGVLIVDAPIVLPLHNVIDIREVAS